MNRLIEIARQLLLPFGDLGVAGILHRLRRLLHLGGRVTRLVLHVAALLPLLTVLPLLAPLLSALPSLPLQPSSDPHRSPNPCTLVL